MNPTALFGAWRLLRFEREEPAGVWRAWPEGAQGLLIYAPSGYMSVALNWPPDEEAGDCDAYAGTFSVEGDRVLHHVTNSVRPKRIGKTLERLAVLDGDILTLHAVNRHGRLRVVWQKIPDH